MERAVAARAGRWLDTVRSRAGVAQPHLSDRGGATPGTVAVAPARDVNPPISRNDPLYREFLDWRASRQKANNPNR